MQLHESLKKSFVFGHASKGLQITHQHYKRLINLSHVYRSYSVGVGTGVNDSFSVAVTS